jgi:hypothetical protein
MLLKSMIEIVLGLVAPTHPTRKLLRKRIGCFLVLLCGISGSAHATLFAYDGFNYTLSQTVVGQGADAGWSSPGQTYTQSQGDSADALSEMSAMVPYQDLMTSGNQLQLNGTTAPGNNEGVYRNLGSTYNTAGNIFWFSVLLQVDSGAGTSYAGISLFSSTSEQYFFGQPNVSTTWGMEQHAGAGASSTVSLLNSATGFLVVELDGINQTASLFVNPTSLGAGAPATPDATFAFSDFSFDRIRLQAGNENLNVDELRFGSSYADVTPAPEPGVVMLAALGVLIFMLVQRGWKRQVALRSCQ